MAQPSSSKGIALLAIGILIGWWLAGRGWLKAIVLTIIFAIILWWLS